jgi:hypothetical protein
LILRRNKRKAEKLNDEVEMQDDNSNYNYQAINANSTESTSYVALPKNYDVFVQGSGEGEIIAWLLYNPE